MSLYVQVGLYAEGPSDYDFLLPLLDRLVDDLLAQHFPGEATVQPPPLGLDAPESDTRRELRIAAVLERYQETIQILVVHADADGDPTRARAERVEPGLRRGRASLKNTVQTVACVPVQMIEAWMLADREAFRSLLGREVEVPTHPDALGDPKPALQQVLRGGRRRRPLAAAQFLGENVRIDALRRLAAFRAFEAELLAAIRVIARPSAAR